MWLLWRYGSPSEMLAYSIKPTMSLLTSGSMYGGLQQRWRWIKLNVMTSLVYRKRRTIKQMKTKQREICEQWALWGDLYVLWGEIQYINTWWLKGPRLMWLCENLCICIIVETDFLHNVTPLIPQRQTEAQIMARKAATQRTPTFHHFVL